ncbi:MAG TPA: DUF3748 domain-containing protein [Candidatus Hydrogenedentes bacterium]|nr:DUF3748 domain-containing protein [Candidatus Hydrogenedentota bacterium]
MFKFALTVTAFIGGGILVASAGFAQSLPPERQITSSPRNHMLDNNDNFSADGRFLCYDTRETSGPGIDNSQAIEKVEIATGKETVLYAPKTQTGAQPAPGIGAASYCPVADKVVFIHGPLLEQVAERGPYAKTNRTGVEVSADGSQALTRLDARDVDNTRLTTPGAHRGGTHRHEYTADGKRIGFTYDDHLLPNYDRTIGYMEANPKAPAGVTHYFAALVPIAPRGTSRAGELEKAAGDSWVGRQGLMRAFIGKVRCDDGTTYEDSLFVVDIPASVDITTAHSGGSGLFPAPPAGVHVRRLTHAHAEGIVRGAPSGDRIAYLAAGEDGTRQIYVIASDGSDKDENPAKRPFQLTELPKGVTGDLRWHPSGNSIACISNNGIVTTCVAPGPRFGQSVFLTAQGDAPERSQLVWSPDGATLAYCKPAPTRDANGQPAKTYNGKDCVQIFTIAFPDANKDGIADLAS